jgi:site-specific DNA-methyltransferase (adenine-specific)
MARMPDKFIDLTVTSPPYDNLRDYKGYDFDFESIAKELYRVTKDGGVVVWVVGDATINGSETGTSFKQALFFKNVCGFKLHDTMIWDKKSFFGDCPNRYNQVFEYMFVLTKQFLKTFNPIIDVQKTWFHKGISTRTGKNGTLRTQNIKQNKNKLIKRCNIFKYLRGFNLSSKDKCSFEHPAIFPESLAADHIISWSNPVDLVYDPFMGSGTTAKMCVKYERNYIGSEISKEYCDIAEKRINMEKSQLKLFSELEN